MPTILMVPPSASKLAVAPFGKVSVVMIACAASATPPAFNWSVSWPITALMRSAGSGSPITPVEDENTRSRGIDSAEATPPVTLSTAS